jgi:hypothetical protein
VRSSGRHDKNKEQFSAGTKMKRFFNHLETNPRVHKKQVGSICRHWGTEKGAHKKETTEETKDGET